MSEHCKYCNNNILPKNLEFHHEFTCKMISRECCAFCKKMVSTEKPDAHKKYCKLSCTVCKKILSGQDIQKHRSTCVIFNSFLERSEKDNKEKHNKNTKTLQMKQVKKKKVNEWDLEMSKFSVEYPLIAQWIKKKS